MKPVYQFFALTFLISWGLWSPFYFSENLSEFWALPGAWGPTISAILVTRVNEGKKGLIELFKKLKIWRVSFKYYLLAIALPCVLVILAMLLAYLFFDTEINFHSISNGMGLEKDDGLAILLMLPVFFLVSTFFGGPVAEELGWRGFAQDKLQLKYEVQKAGLIVGIFWVLWHIPLMFFLPQGIGHLPIPAYALIMINMSMLMAWLYNKTKASVLLAILFHAGVNFESGILGTENLEQTPTLIIYIILLSCLNIILYFKEKIL